MRKIFGNLAVLILAMGLGSVVVIGGCEGQVRYYDAGYGDYHTWNHGEVVYYNNWEHQTHREHVDFAKRNEVEKKEYYTWRHSQSGNHPGH